MAASQQEKPVKLTNSMPQLPSVTTPHFSGGKLARIRKKIEEKQILLEGGVPVQFLKQTATASEEEDEDSTLAEGDETIKEKSKPSTTPIRDITEAKGEEGDLVLCNTCGRSFPPARIQLHQQICGGSAEKLSTIPFIVKLGIRRVDGDKDKTAAEEAAAKLVVEDDGNEKNSQTDVMGGRQGRIEANKSEEFGITPQTIQYPGGGNNWKEGHNRFIKCLEEAKQAMEQYASGNFPRLPPPPGPRELEMDFVQCSNCLRRLVTESSSNHFVKCTS